MAQSDSDHPLEGTESPVKRVGFWLGLTLFVVLLVADAPRSMHETVRRHFADAVNADVERLLASSAAGAAAPAATYESLEQRVVAQRADVMMSAAAVTAVVACWWMTVAIPIPVTSLLPLVLFPLVGVMSVRSAAPPYANHNIFLFMGGFIIALGIERWGLHRRIALNIIRVFGTGRARIVLGFMVASALLSMWISNTATAMMMLPIGMALISTLSQLDAGLEHAEYANFSAALMLGIAYAASIGGIATPIGTPPNIAFKGQFAWLFPDAPDISFGQWMLVFVPLVAVFLPLVWIVLVRVTCRVTATPSTVGADVVRRELQALGPMRRPEKLMLAVFAMTALLWITRSIHIGGADYGWAYLVQRWCGPADSGVGGFHASYINDATVALLMAVVLFLVPAHGRADKSPGSQRQYLMNWSTARNLPWGILLLFGGGFSIAEGFKVSGLSAWCGQILAGLHLTNPLLLIATTCLLMTFLTEITSNTATTQIMLPILSRAGLALGTDPLMLMLPATLSASCAFMLPVATPPNAIVFSSGRVHMKRMVMTGLILNLLGVILVTATFLLIARPLLGINLTSLPDWAQ